MMLLVNLDAGRYLHSAERDQLFRDTTDFTLVRIALNSPV